MIERHLNGTKNKNSCGYTIKEQKNEMSKGRELVKNTGILFIGKISTQFVSFLLLPLYTAKLSTEAYGTLDLYTTVGSFLIPFLSLQLEQAIFRYLLTNEEDEKSVLSSTTAYLILSSLVMVAVYLPVARVISIQYAGRVLLYYLTLLFATVVQQVPRGYGNYTLYTVVSFLSSTVSIVFSVLFICVFNQGIDGILTARIISHVFIVIFVVLTSHIAPKIRFRYCSIDCLKSMVRYSVPLVFNQIGSWVVNYSDRIIIIGFLGVGANGVYAIANKFFSLITTTLNIYNVAWTESVTKALNDRDRNIYYNKVFSLTTSLFLMVATGVIGGIGILFKYFINENYDAAYYQIPLLVYAAMFSGLAANVGSVYIAYKKTKEISLTTLLTAVINIIIHVAFVKFIGLYAASLSTLVSFVVMFFYRIYKLKDIEPLRFKFVSLLPQLPFMVLILVTYYKREFLLQLVALIFFAAYAIYYLFHEKTFKVQMEAVKGKIRGKQGSRWQWRD